MLERRMADPTNVGDIQEDLESEDMENGPNGMGKTGKREQKSLMFTDLATRRDVQRLL